MLPAETDVAGFPQFYEVSCKEIGSPSYKRCYHVDYPNDRTDDYLLLNRLYDDNEFLLGGYLRGEQGAKVTVELPEDQNTNYTRVSDIYSIYQNTSNFHH